jgi:hypothetical protein
MISVGIVLVHISAVEQARVRHALAADPVKANMAGWPIKSDLAGQDPSETERVRGNPHFLLPIARTTLKVALPD